MFDSFGATAHCQERTQYSSCAYGLFTCSYFLCNVYALS